MTLDELPEILTAKHIAEYLSLSRKTVYEYSRQILNMAGYPVLILVVPKEWTSRTFEARKKEKASRFMS